MQYSPSAKQLKSLLQIDFNLQTKENISKYDEIAGEFAKSIILVGAGEIGKKTLAGLKKIGINPLSFADNNKTLWGKTVEGLIVLSLTEATRKYSQTATFVVTVYNNSLLLDQLHKLNCQRVVSFTFLFWKYHKFFLPYYSLNVLEKISREKDDISRMYSLWADAKSRDEYFFQLKWRLKLDKTCLKPPLPIKQMFFPFDLVTLTEDETFIDCGAFDGDSIRNFINNRNMRFNRIMAIEPDTTNFTKLKKFINSLPAEIKDRICARQCAVSRKPGKIRFNATGTVRSTIALKGGTEVECTTLDEITKGMTPTFIKMDIEGAEEDALKGARNLITKGNCIWAVCLYHRSEDLWRIPLFIRSLSTNYYFYLRRYAEESWEEICYAIPRERVRSF